MWRLFGFVPCLHAMGCSNVKVLCMRHVVDKLVQRCNQAATGCTLHALQVPSWGLQGLGLQLSSV